MCDIHTSLPLQLSLDLGNPDSSFQHPCLAYIPPMEHRFHYIVLLTSKNVIRVFYEMQGVRSWRPITEGASVDQRVVTVKCKSVRIDLL